MSKHPVLPLWVFYFFLFQSVCLVPSPTNISVVCHNLVNVLYWNYSKPTEHLNFSVTVKPYTGMSQTIETFQTYLNISEYSDNAEDDYFVTVKARDEQEESKSVSIKFTYNRDYAEENSYKCSFDFPPIITSVHKNVINVSFQHPYSIYKQSTMGGFAYKVTHDEIGNTQQLECYAEEELCTEEIRLFESVAGKCINLTFEGTIDIYFTTAYKNVCLSEMPDASVDNLSYISALVGGGVVILSIVVGLVWLLCRKWSKIPKLPEVLNNFMNQNKPATIFSSPVEQTSSVSSMGHSPLLQTESSDFTRLTISPPEKDTTIIPTDTEAEIVQETSDTYERDVNFDDSGDYKSSDYDSPKLLQEMSPGDFTTGYGPRPPIL